MQGRAERETNRHPVTTNRNHYPATRTENWTTRNFYLVTRGAEKRIDFPPNVKVAHKAGERKQNKPLPEREERTKETSLLPERGEEGREE